MRCRRSWRSGWAMADDIVTRLREYEAITDNAYVINALVAAADEIERLREQLRALEAERDQWQRQAVGD